MSNMNSLVLHNNNISNKSFTIEEDRVILEMNDLNFGFFSSVTIFFKLEEKNIDKI